MSSHAGCTDEIMDFWQSFTLIKPSLGIRAETFEAMFKYLDGFNRPVSILETGCAHLIEAWAGHGKSTVLFDWYVQDRGGLVHTVDINPENTKLCNEMTSDKVKIHTGDSIDYLKSLTDISPDLVYLDSYDWTESEAFESALHCANEFQAIKPILRHDTLIVVDDSLSETQGSIKFVSGKGAFLGYYANKKGAKALFQDYQIGWTRMV